MSDKWIMIDAASGKAIGPWVDLPDAPAIAQTVAPGWLPPATGQDVWMQFAPTCNHTTASARYMTRDVYERGQPLRAEYRIECRECGAKYETKVLCT